MYKVEVYKKGILFETEEIEDDRIDRAYNIYCNKMVVNSFEESATIKLLEVASPDAQTLLKECDMISLKKGQTPETIKKVTISNK